MIGTLITAVAGGLLAFANGANDNSKGVATLIGAGVARATPALWFAAVTTFLGSVTAIFLAGTLIARFGGRGIVEDSLAASPAFPACVGLAAGLTVLLATRIGMPISTTHALVGAIAGVGVSAGSLHVGATFSAFFVPLLVSPLIAIVLAAGAYVVLRAVRRRAGVTQATCLCVGQRPQPVTLTANGALAMASTGVELTVGEAAQCREKYIGRVVGCDAQRVLDVAHYGSAGAISFARGLNDTPKIAAIFLGVHVLTPSGGPGWAIVVTGLTIAAGGLLAVRRVAETMSHRITGMNDGQGFTANATAAILVILASRLGVPVSTTHVTCGGLFGIGLVNGQAHWPVVARVLAAWVTTLPLAALLGWAAWRLAMAAA